MFLSIAIPAHSQSQLPDGPGKQTVQVVCSYCHTLDRVTETRLTPQEWKDLVNLMVVYGAPLRPADVAVVTDYLTKNFKGEPKPKGVVIPGPVQASIKEWVLPTPGTRPHDPAVAPDGSIWYTGQASDLLGRLDPATSQFKEYKLQTGKSAKQPYGAGPHGLVADTQGNIWFTAQMAGYVGKLDPKTGDITKYQMPDPNARDPHTPIIDQQGTVWFTLQNSDMVGRIIPATGDVKVVHVPTPKAEPYGIVVNSKGVPFFVELTGHRIASIDPKTMEIREYVLPSAGAMPRRIAVTPDDVVWYTDYARGYLGRFDPKTGKFTEWPSPSGRTSQPYGITAVGNVLYYSESNVAPNTVVRFDPATEKMQTWLIPSGGGVVRFMTHGADGSLWLACSGVDRITRVEIR
jgi:virginiamycin B lyase